MASAAGDGPVGQTLNLPIRSNSLEVEGFDIVETYKQLLKEDADLTMPVAALEALIKMLGHTRSQTVFETMDLVKHQSAKLRKAFPNPVALSHGTDLFQQYLLMSLKQHSASSTSSAPALDTRETFDTVREHLIRNARLFVQRAKDQRHQVALFARRYIRDDSVVLTHGGSRLIYTILQRAAQRHDYDAPRRFKVIYAVDDNSARSADAERIVESLRACDIPVAVIPESAVAHVMQKVSLVLVGCEAITANGGIISRIGTYQLACLAKQHRKDFFVAGEQHKFGKTFPTSQSTMTFRQDILDFRVADDQSDASQSKPNFAEAVDFTPPELINSFFCNHGVKIPSEVAREILDYTL